MQKFIWLVCEDDCPLVAVETEADAEELFMDLVMEAHYWRAMSIMHFQDYSVKDIEECEWIWLSDEDYWITHIPQLN